MKIIEDLSVFKTHYQNCVATIGKYDGMHLGHQKILERVKQEADIQGLPSVVILSEPQPEEFFSGINAPVRLNHFRDKVEFLDNFGIDAVYRMNFDYELSQYSPERFIQEILVEGLAVKTLIIGDDFRFGKDREGDFSLLEQSAKAKHFTVFAEKPCLVNQNRASSTAVREYLSAGDCEKVTKLLGRNYSISGEVIKGQQLGRKLGTPTANIKLESEKVPLLGIYAVKVELNQEEYFGVASIGFNPTVNSEKVLNLEVFIFEFDENIYGSRLKVLFVEKIRDEKKYRNIEELKEQIHHDVNIARGLFSLDVAHAKRAVDVR